MGGGRGWSLVRHPPPPLQLQAWKESKVSFLPTWPVYWLLHDEQLDPTPTVPPPSLLVAIWYMKLEEGLDLSQCVQMGRTAPNPRTRRMLWGFSGWAPGLSRGPQSPCRGLSGRPVGRRLLALTPAVSKAVQL